MRNLLLWHGVSAVAKFHGYITGTLRWPHNLLKHYIIPDSNELVVLHGQLDDKDMYMTACAFFSRLGTEGMNQASCLCCSKQVKAPVLIGNPQPQNQPSNVLN